jgi:hypothetical protein
VIIGNGWCGLGNYSRRCARNPVVSSPSFTVLVQVTLRDPHRIASFQFHKFHVLRAYDHRIAIIYCGADEATLLG